MGMKIFFVLRVICTSLYKVLHNLKMVMLEDREDLVDEIADPAKRFFNSPTIISGKQA